MIFEYTEQEKQQLIAIDKAIAAKLDDLDKIILSSSKDSAEYQEATREATRLEDERQQAFAELYEQVELKHFKAISGSTDSIIRNAKEQTEAIINHLYQTMLELYGRLKGDEKSPSGLLVIPIQNIIENEKTSLRADVEQGGIILNATQTLAMIRSGLHLHFKALKNDKEALAVINDYIITTVTNSPYIAKYDATAPPKEEIKLLGEMKTIGNTITLVDKLTYRLAAGVVPYKEIVPVKMEKGRSKKPITTYINLDIEEISDILPSNIGGEDINLLEAIISLLIGNIKNGINTFRLNDIYRVERKNLKVNPNKRIQEQLKNRILKLMKTLITIDSSEEKQAYYKNTDLFYKETSNLLNAHFLEVEVKGNKTMAIKILDIPLLYRYSEAKKQLTTIPFILTDNKLPKTSAVLILEKYLLRRISQMKNNNKLTRSILYSTIYDNMNFKHKSKSSIENAKAKTRINTEEILKQLIQTNYIKDYQIEKEGRNQYHRLKIIL